MTEVSIPQQGRGVWAECSQCHRAVWHGFQVCQHCGHIVTADQQTLVRHTLKVNAWKFLAVAFFLYTVLFVISYSVFG